jgi:hypothetical protein
MARSLLDFDLRHLLAYLTDHIGEKVAAIGFLVVAHGEADGEGNEEEDHDNDGGKAAALTGIRIATDTPDAFGFGRSFVDLALVGRAGWWRAVLRDFRRWDEDGGDGCGNGLGFDFAVDEDLADDADEDVPFLEDEDEDDFPEDEIDGLPGEDDADDR